MDRTRIRAAAVACAVLAACSSPEVAPDAAVSQDGAALLLQYQSVLDFYMAKNAEERRYAAAGGIEMGTAGIHLASTRIKDDPHPSSTGFPYPGETIVRDWCFWRAEAWRELEASELFIGVADVVNWVSFRRMVRPALFQYRILPGTEVGEYLLSGTLDARSLDACRALLTPKSVDHSTGVERDWYGVPRAVGARESKMRLVLVAEDVAHIPFHVQAILRAVDARGLSSYDVTLTGALTLAEAEALLALL